MKTLLIIFLFTMNPDGSGLSQSMVEAVPFDTKEECQTAGANLRQLVDIPNDIYTLSVCVAPEDHFQ